MSRRWTELEAQFTAHDNAGQRYHLLVYRTMLESRTFGGRSVDRGLAEIRTSDGRAVNQITKGQHEIVGHPNIPVTSDDPSAP